MNLRVRSVTGCSRSAIFAYGRRSVRKSACEISRQKPELWVVDEVAVD